MEGGGRRNIKGGRDAAHARGQARPQRETISYQDRISRQTLSMFPLSFSNLNQEERQTAFHLVLGSSVGKFDVNIDER